MDDFNDVQQKAQELTANVTNGSPAQKINTPSNNDESFTYAGYGEREEPKTKTTGSTTVLEGRNDSMFAVPYSGGGSYPGSVLYGAEINSDDTVVGLKSKYTPVEPYDLQIGNMYGKVDTLNLRKAFYELAYTHTPRGVDERFWYGYDIPIEPAHESFLEGTGRGILNLPGQLIGTAGSAIGWIPATLTTAYGELTNDDNAIKFGNDMLEATRDITEDFLSHTTFNYGEMGDNSGQNKSGVIVGSLLGSIPLSLLTGVGGASTFAGVEGLSNAYEARYAAYDRGVSGLGGLGIALGAGTATAALGVSSKFMELPVKGLLKPSIGWARALKENPKQFMQKALLKNFIVGTYDATTESAQDLITAYLGKGRLEPEDWEQAWLTMVFGVGVGAMAAAVKTKADKRGQQYYNDQVKNLYVENKDVFDRIIKESNGAITQETVDTYFEFLSSENSRTGFVSYLKNKMAENIDKYDSMPDEFKQRIESIVKAGDGATPLAKEMATLDANIDNMLNNVQDLGDVSKNMARQFIRGIALYDYMYRGTNPSEFELPTIVADIAPGKSVKTDKSGVVHLNQASDKDLKPIGQQMVNVDQLNESNYKKSGLIKNEAILAAQRSANTSFETPRGRALTGHELFHWMEKKTKLPKVADFMRRMTAWTENVLPGITSGKGEGTVERSEAYAYAVQYAKSLKGLLGLSGDMRKYIELFNAVSAANSAAQEFENYNKVLQQEIKRNAKTLDELLSSYGEDNLRNVIKQYAKTGNLGLLKQEDLKRLFEVMESVVDSQTIEKMNTAFGDKGTAQSFIERYEAEYDASQEAEVKRAELAKNVVKAKQQVHTNSIAQQSNELQKYIVEGAKVVDEDTAVPENKTKTSSEETISTEPVSETNVEENTEAKTETNETQVEEQQSETPPYMQYTGERKPAVRSSEEQTYFEKWLDGQKIPVDKYNKLMDIYTSIAQRVVGVVPSGSAKYIVRQSQASNKPDGVMTAEWAPTASDLEAMGLPANAISMMSSDQLTAVGRVLALRDAEAVYSVADDIADITGGGNDNPFFDMLTKKAEIKEDEALIFVQEAEDVINALQDFSGSLTHSGTTLSDEDAMREISLLDRAIGLKTFDTSVIKDEEVKATVDKFIEKINLDALADRLSYLTRQFSPFQADTKVLYLKNKPFNSTDPWGVWNQYGAKKRPLTSVLNYGLNTLTSFDVSYWIDRMGLDVDKYPSVQVLESIVTKKGLAPVDFSNVTVNLAGKKVPLFEAQETQPAEYGAIYGHQGVNQAVNSEVNLKALKHVLGKRPTKDKLVGYLLEQVKDQINPDVLHLSLEEKLREIAALGRAKMIADDVFAQYNDTISKFSQWATLTAKGRVAVGADLEGLSKETKQQNFEKLQEQEITAGREPYMARKDLDINKLPTGLQIAFLYSGSWKQGVITASNQQAGDNGPRYYAIRVLNDGTKGTYDLVWDAREFELLQKTPMGSYENALFAKPTRMSKEDFDKIISEEYWKENYVQPKDEIEHPADYSEYSIEKYNFTAAIADAKQRKKYKIGEWARQGGSTEADFDPTESYGDVLYSVSGDELMDLEPDPFPELSDEEFENVEPEYRQLMITGKEKTNQEVYEKMKMAEEANRRPITRYLEQNVPGFGKSIVKVMQELIDVLKTRKVSPILFFMTGGSGPQARTAGLFGDKEAQKLGVNRQADRAERVTEDFKKDVEKALLAKTFKNQKELGAWQVRIGVDVDNVKAKLNDGFEHPISRDEIMSLYLAELSKDGKNADFRIPYMYGGTIESNGYTYLYNKLHSTYTNFDELIGVLTEQDKQAAEVLARFLPVLRGVDMNDSTSWFGKFVPVNTYSDYATTDGWGNRRSHNTAVFGTRLLNPDSNLVAVGLYNSAMSMAGGAGVRAYNYLLPMQMFNDMLNLAILTDPGERYSRGFRMDLDKNEEMALNEAVKLSKQLNDLIEEKVGKNNLKSYKLAISDTLSKDPGTTAKTWFGEKFQKITRTASAMALSLKPRQIFTNLNGNYEVLGGLSSHSVLWYNTVGLSNAIAHLKEAWDSMLDKNGTFRHRWEQSAMAEQYRRVADMKSDSIIQDIEKEALQKGLTGTANALASADALAKILTKYSIGATNTLPDMIGLALGRWVVLEDVKSRIAAQAAADGVKMSEEQIAIEAENQIADYMFSHISSSNIMARGRISKEFARHGFEGLAAFKNDQLQKTAALSNAVTRLMNTKDEFTRTQAWREIEGIVLSDFMYVAIQAGVIRALYKTLTGDDMSDKEEEYMWHSFLRESLGQVADAFNGSAFIQPILESIFLGKEGGLDFLPFPEIKRITRNARKGDWWEVGGTGVGLLGFSPAERAIQITRALSMVFGDDERAAQVGWLMLAGRSESTAKNMLGYTKNKKGQIVPKKSNKKKD